MGTARRWVTDQLNSMYSRPDDVAGDARTVVSELVTNAIRADSKNLTLCIEGHHAYVSISTTDDAPGMPVRQAPRPDAASGRGLLIVEALSRKWGVQRGDRGKTVWADIGVAPNASPTFDCLS